MQGIDKTGKYENIKTIDEKKKTTQELHDLNQKCIIQNRFNFYLDLTNLILSHLSVNTFTEKNLYLGQIAVCDFKPGILTPVTFSTKHTVQGDFTAETDSSSNCVVFVDGSRMHQTLTRSLPIDIS